MSCLRGCLAFVIVMSAWCARGAQFVSSVVSYDPGTYAGTLVQSAAAVGAPSPIVGAGTGFDSILSPFNPHYEATDIVGIGRGGHITMAFAHPIMTIAGRELGIVTNLGLVDASYPNGLNTNPASTFNLLPRAGDVEVSFDGTTFFPVGRVTFENPANYYANATNPYLTSPPSNPVFADFGKPYLGGLSPTFDGRDWTQTLATLDGSAGGTWVDASSAPLQSFQYVRISIPTNGIDGSDNQVFVDAVSANNIALPEPAMGLCMCAAALVLTRRRP